MALRHREVDIARVAKPRVSQFNEFSETKQRNETLVLVAPLCV